MACTLYTFYNIYTLHFNSSLSQLFVYDMIFDALKIFNVKCQSTPDTAMQSTLLYL